MVAGYRRQRALLPCEVELWNDFLRIAACRFWLSRLYDSIDSDQLQDDKPQSDAEPSAGKLLQSKDPETYKNILRKRIDHPFPLS